MPRVIGWVFNGITVLSLLLCVATLGMWVRSYFGDDALERVDSGWYVLCGSSRGRFFYCCDATPFLPDTRWTYSSTRAGEIWRFASTDIERRLPGGIGYSGNWRLRLFRYIVVPHWLPAVLLAVLPVVRVIRSSQRRRASAMGFCPICNYDLRATPDRCPECGTIPPDAPGKPAG